MVPILQGGVFSSVPGFVPKPRGFYVVSLVIRHDMDKGQRGNRRVSQWETHLCTSGAAQSCSLSHALGLLAQETEPSRVCWDKGPRFPLDGAALQDVGWQQFHGRGGNAQCCPRGARAVGWMSHCPAGSSIPTWMFHRSPVATPGAMGAVLGRLPSTGVGSS